MTALMYVLSGLLSWNVYAQEAAPAEDLEPPPPVVTLERIPPRTSYELGVQIGFASLPQFEADVSAWPGFGARFNWGKNIALHRIGFGISGSLEGPAPKFYTLAIEPNVAWDFVSGKGFALGASVGPSLLLNSELTLRGSELTPNLAPTAAFRVGWSQSWSRMGRRMHVYFEPKLRMTTGGLGPGAAVVIGSGRGK